MHMYSTVGLRHDPDEEFARYIVGFCCGLFTVNRNTYEQFVKEAKEHIVRGRECRSFWRGRRDLWTHIRHIEYIVDIDGQKSAVSRECWLGAVRNVLLLAKDVGTMRRGFCDYCDVDTWRYYRESTVSIDVPQVAHINIISRYCATDGSLVHILSFVNWYHLEDGIFRNVCKMIIDGEIGLVHEIAKSVHEGTYVEEEIPEEVVEEEIEVEYEMFQQFKESVLQNIVLSDKSEEYEIERLLSPWGSYEDDYDDY